MKMHRNEEDGSSEGTCDVCGDTIYRYRGQPGDLDCDCGAIYNAFGQRLRDDLHTRPNPSEWDDNISDLDGFEAAYRGDES